MTRRAAEITHIGLGGPGLGSASFGLLSPVFQGPTVLATGALKGKSLGYQEKLDLSVI